jgi:beta-glucosidase
MFLRITMTSGKPADSNFWPHCASPVGQDAATELRVADVLSRMTLEQKVGQMIQAEIAAVTPAQAAEHHLGSVLNGGGSFPNGDKHASVADWVALAESYRAASSDAGPGRLGIPLIWGTDAVHGHNNVYRATIFPHNIGLGAAGDPDLIEEIGAATAREIAATGIGWTFAPTLAVVRDDRWGRTYESYSEDPQIIRAYAGRMVTGLQGPAGTDAFLGAGRVVATAKHFLGEGGTEGGVDQGENNADETTLRDVHGQGYVTALGSGAQTVMATFNSWRGVKVHGHRYLLTDVLKGQMGFEGFVVSDWNGFKQVADCRQEACQLSINAGVDMLMIPDDWQEVIGDLVALVEDGQIPMSRIDDAVTRILRVKARAGLLDPAESSDRPHTDPAVVGCAAHRDVARRAVRQSLVMLKNRGGMLPLDPSLHVLVAGDGADDIGKQSGGWTLTWQGTENENGDFPGASSIYDGISAAVTNAGGRATLSPDGSWSERPDVAVVVFGEDPYAEGQGDRAHLSFSALFPEGLGLLKKLKGDGIPVVSVFLTGRPLWVNAELNASDAFVVAWLPGSEGAGVSDVLFRTVGGEVAHDFTGRLAFSWPRSSLQATVNRHDADYDPLFPYGFGLGAADVDTLGDELIEEDEALGLAADESIGILTGRVVPPFEFFIGDSQAWKVPVRGRSSRSPTGAVSVTNVDHYSQEDARRISWDGSGGAQVYFQRSAGQDLSDHASRGARLRCKLRVDVRPQRRVELRMDSGYPQTASIDITAMLNELPLGTWEDVAFEMSAFAGGTDNLCAVDTPWLIWTDGVLGLSVSNLRIDLGDG